MDVAKGAFPVFMLVVISILYEYLVFRYGYFFKEGHKGTLLLSAFLGIVRTVFTVVTAVNGLPLVMYFFCIGVVYGGQILLRRDESYKALVSYVLSFLIHSSVLLFLVGGIGFVKSLEIPELFQSMFLRCFTLFAAYIISCIITILMHIQVRSELLEIEHERKQDDLFLMFLGWCVAYVYADALFSRYKGGNVVQILLMGGNFLLLLLVFLFLNRKKVIAKNRILEREHESLLAERARKKIQKEKLQKTIDRDTLTGCYSRRFVMREMRRLHSENELFSIVFIDLDGLKKINDSQGHQAGDQLLIRFVEHVQRRLEEEEILARMGGDEFLIIMAGSDMDEAEKRIEILRESLLNTDNCPVSFSYGVASGISEISELIHRADEAMYRDKTRRRTVTSDV